MLDPLIRQKISDMVITESNQYTPSKAYGLFINGKRVSSNTGKYYWKTEFSAKKALAYHLGFFKNSYYLNKYGLMDADVEKLYNICLEEGIAEIRPIGDI